MSDSYLFGTGPLKLDLACYPPDYHTSRDSFLGDVRALDAAVESFPVQTVTRALQGALYIDIATLGDPKARRKLVVIAGTHGVEGYLGAAIQRSILKNLRRPPKLFSVSLVHCLNPWGMAMVRRCNESNVDLNRNCVLRREDRVGAPDGYEMARSLIMPRGEIAFPRFFSEALIKVIRHGFRAMKRAITGGQYVDPLGLYYGGRELEQEIVVFQRWVAEHVATTDHVRVIDIHSGLGNFCESAILLDFLKQSDEYDRIVSLFGVERVHAPDSEESLTYETRGALSNVIPALCPSTTADQLVQEFGTFHPFRVLHALVNENSCFMRNPDDRQGTAVAALKEAFCPSSIRWRHSALLNGCELFRAALKGWHQET